MVKTVTDFAGQNEIKEVAEIVLDIGELSLVIPKYVEDIYPVVVGDTWLKDTKLVINVIPGMAECDECNELFNGIEHEGYCPNCGSFEKNHTFGQGFSHPRDTHPRRLKTFGLHVYYGAPQRTKSQRLFYTLQKRHIFCKNKFSQKISLRSSKSLIKRINQFFSRF